MSPYPSRLRLAGGLRLKGLLGLLCFCANLLAGPLSPADAQKSFQLEPGLAVHLVVAEPLTASPCAIAWDERGRLFVVENRGYPTGPGPGKPPAGQIAMLLDTNGDGRMDQRVLFADNLTFPNGILPWRGGFFVTCAPDILYLKDTDGDGRADERKVVLTGYSTNGSTQLRVSHPILGPDGWVYLASGLSGGKVISPLRPGAPPVDLKGDSRFHPDTFICEPVDGRAQFGHCFDEIGRRFHCMNRIPVQHVVLPSRFLNRNPNLQFSDTVQDCPEEKEMVRAAHREANAGPRLFPISANITTADSHAGSFTAACALHIYESMGLPDEFYGNAFSCDAAANLIHRDRLVERGATFAAVRAREGIEFLASPDDWFRPVFLATGPDGAIYVCDMYRKVIEHPDYLPEEIRRRTDFNTGKDMGRIWRVVGQGRVIPTSVPGTEETVLYKDLGSPIAWRRERACRLLLEKSPGTLMTHLTEILTDLNPSARSVPPRERLAPPDRSNPEPIRAVRALNLLHAARQHSSSGGRLASEVTRDLYLRASTNIFSSIRETAFRLLGEEKGVPSPSDALIEFWASDPSAKARFYGALFLGNVKSDASTRALARIAARDHDDRWARAAVLSGIAGRTPAFYRSLTSDGQTPGSELLSELCRMIAVSENASECAAILGDLLAAPPAAANSWAIAGLHGLAEGLRVRKIDSLRSFQELLKHVQAGAASARMETFASRVLQLAGDPAAPAELRAKAIFLLQPFQGNAAIPILIKIVARERAPELQKSAVRALARFSAKEAKAGLLEPNLWQQLSPPIRELILTSLISDPASAQFLLDQFASHELKPGELTPAQRRQLLQHRDPAIRQRAQDFLAAPDAGDRKEIYDQWKVAASLKGHPAQGKAIFLKLCANCHRLDREGSPVGPDLFSMRSQPKESILLHILVPEAEVVPAYASYEIVKKDGESVTGLIASETENSITLRRALGETEVINRSEIASLRASQLSLMPQGLEQGLIKQDMADLLAYLKGEGAD